MNADIVMMVSILALGFGLVPQIIKNFRIKTCGVVFGTTAITTVALWVMVGCFYSMEKWFSLFGCSTQAVMWTTMLVQWFTYRPKRPECSSCKHSKPGMHFLAYICKITKREYDGGFVCGRFKERSK